VAESIRDRVAQALFWTTEQLEPGRGRSQVRIYSMYLDDIQKHTRRGDVTRVYPRYAFRAWYLPEDTGGSDVSVEKKQDGISALLDEEFLVARNHSLIRTIVEGGTLVGCQAEPVTAFVKATKVAAFRITGAEKGLYALDPAIGSENKQTEFRDRIVARIDGEVQAEAGEPDISGPGRSAVMRLMGHAESSDLRNPRLDASGILEMSIGEECLYHSRHQVIVSRSESTAYGSAWQEMPGLSIPAEVWITSRRVAASWPDWSQDAASTVMVDRRRLAGYPDVHQGGAVAGHFSWAWISQIFVGNNERSPGVSSLEFQATDRLTLVRIRIIGLESLEAERLMREAAASVAAYRTQTDETLTAEDRTALGLIEKGRAEVEQLSWGKSIVLPSNFKIGRDKPGS